MKIGARPMRMAGPAVYWLASDATDSYWGPIEELDQRKRQDLKLYSNVAGMTTAEGVNSIIFPSQANHKISYFSL